MFIQKIIAAACCSIFIVSLIACNKTPDNDECLEFKQSPVSVVTGPATGNINQDINLAVSFSCFNGCGQFGSFNSTTVADTTTIEVIAKYEGCICTQDLPVRQTNYTFRKSQPGTYHLKFMQLHNAYIVHTITVQ